MVVDDRVVTQSANRQASAKAQEIRANIHFLYVLPLPEYLKCEFLPMAELVDQEFQEKDMTHIQHIASYSLQNMHLSQ